MRTMPVAAERSHCGASCSRLLPVLGLFSLIASGFGLAAYHLKDDPGSFGLVEGTFNLLLVAVFCCLWLKERAAPGSAWRDRLKDFACAFAALLFLCVAYMVMGAADLTLTGAALAWLTAVAAGSGVFVYTFVSRDRYYIPGIPYTFSS